MFPRTGRFDFLFERDLIFMHYTIEEILVNLPWLMIGYMYEAATKAHVSLPYGMVLTLIFKEFGIPISDEKPKWLLHHTDHYNLQTLHRMGYKKENDKWVKKGQSRHIEGVDNTIPESLHTRPISPP